MTRSAWPRLAAALALLGAGCTSLREIPRGQYASQPERRNVRMVTRDGLTYEFDYIHVSGDTLFGYRRLDVPGSVEQYGSMALPLQEVMTLSARSLDWYRTGLIGGGVIVALVAKGLSETTAGSEGGGGGGGGRPGP